MTTVIERFKKIQLNLASIQSSKTVKIIAVSKTFTLEHVRPLLDFDMFILEKTKSKKL